MAAPHHVRVRPLPAWLEPAPLLGPGEWQVQADADGTRIASAELSGPFAADLCARLRGVGVGGAPLVVEVSPPLSRTQVRAGRHAEALRMREGSPGFLRRGTRCDPEARWSLTPEPLALELGRRARGRSVLDAGCGAGGNTLGFARAGCTVAAVESDPERLACARHNAALYGVSDRIRFIAGDAREEVTRSTAEVLFVDPPWGRDYDKHRMQLADLPLLTALLPHRPRFHEMWVKVPPSFDPASVPGARAEAWFGCGRGDAHRIKFLLLIL